MRCGLPIRVCVEKRINDLTRGRRDLVRPSKVAEMIRLDFEKTRLNGRCPPYARGLLEYELKETERLNAMIIKQTRHCAELKAWEEAEEARSKT